MLGFLYILFSSAFYGFSNAYWKKAIQDAPFLQVIFSRGLYTTSFFGLCYLMDYQWGIFTPWLGERPVFTAAELAMSIGLCVFSFFGLYFFVRSLKTEAVSLVSPVSSINLFGLLTAVLFLGETWGFAYSMATLCVVGGVFLLFQSDWHFSSISSFLKALGGSILASFFWGISYSLFKYPVAWLGVIPFSFLLELCVTLCVGVFLLFQKQKWQQIPQAPIRILALCIILGSVFLNIAYKTASITQIIFVSKSQLVLTLIFGQILYREKLKALQLLGIALLLLSIYIVV
ncbi:EamA family transporter [Aquirufa lenticrescens]|uniref:EamA family transporter n=1 Tax=Aquirufa lenticrescens TaxID=2696560 RepID=UPI001CAA7C39|nr:EamA family transporter [Aquirufa lenticrescens]UAJ13540.1 EamA family transporter [Aquirufa lenticrescens]